ncbi:hypothetical protein [uncultured Proteiniphilum sp.]|uniref:hypothetical protein n=1 Tax=uncultured Proteiniphilum sp. TaxID=497637 RepID=UPI0026058D65|nr:hypothetical protein [uncultured Proteiniphilum sp.]
MLIEELEQVLSDNLTTNWSIAPGFRATANLRNRDYIPLSCKVCGFNTRHTLGNLKHHLFNNPNHCSCRDCKAIPKKKERNENFLLKAEKIMSESTSFPWLLDRVRIDKDHVYHAKSRLPLICKTCGEPKNHTYSNILTAIDSPGHIVCRNCKFKQQLLLKLKRWRTEIRRNSSNEYDLISVTPLGYKIIHQICGKSFYVKSPKSFKNAKCPTCRDYAGNILERIKDDVDLRDYIAKQTSGQLTLHSVDRFTKLLIVSCNHHPEQGSYQLSWKSFRISKRNKGAMLCNLCNKQRLRKTSFEEYNHKIANFKLKIAPVDTSEKIDTKEKILHWCTSNSKHPSFLATPEEVLFKNKRCAFCYENVSFHKDYDFIKAYIEMDEDRFYTHSGKKFRLLSSRSEIEGQIRPFSQIGQIRIRVNELTCHLHDEYEVSWSDFRHRNVGCTQCTRENHVSYVHSYYQALLAYFNLDYVAEYPIKIGPKKTYRVDFMLTTTPNYLEIDSSIHVGKGWFRSEKDIYAYQERDRIKNNLLGNNLERIKLYDDKNKHLPMQTQLRIIERAFLDRAIQNNLPIQSENIEAAKRDPEFFRNARIVAHIKRLEYFHKDHIEFKHADHLSMLHLHDMGETEFYCKIHGKTFLRKFYSVAKLYFLCPICKDQIKLGKQQSYYMSEEKIQQISSIVNIRFDDKIVIDSDHWGDKVSFFLTLVFPVSVRNEHKTILLFLNELLCSEVAEIKNRLKQINNPDSFRKVKHKRYIPNYEPVRIDKIDQKERSALYKLSKIMLGEYQNKAKSINRLMKDEQQNDYIESLIDNNEKSLKPYIHKSESEAKGCLGTFDRKIIPFFSQSEEMELLTLREHYAYNKQYLLIKRKSCGHRFYCSWNWIMCRRRDGKGIQCQHKDCFDKYYKEVYKSGNKISNQEILDVFKKKYFGQYYPLYPDVSINVRDLIDVVHLPTGRKFKTRFDNFRRGKFRCPYKKMSLEELSENSAQILH